ncbi:MAG TPA: type II toxin-antitoxin system VapC family toxin [Gemmataceae bacterium]|jgi:predicted nucleic acid-binding protein|nr:type II toxin-antitoxin system VapC family toxin [Gemmataceae bacterium]
MTLADVAAGTTIFVDANVFLFALTHHPVQGAACESFLDRAENQEIVAVTSTHVLGEVVHRLMTIEACDRFGWPNQGIANRLRRHPGEVQQLLRPRQALDEIAAARVSSGPIPARLVALAVDLSRQTGLLYGDALVVAFMQDQGLSHLASLDADFDRVPGLTRYAPA